MYIYMIERSYIRSIQIFRYCSKQSSIMGEIWDGTNPLKFYILFSIPDNQRFKILSTDAYDTLCSLQSMQIKQLLYVST